MRSLTTTAVSLILLAVATLLYVLFVPQPLTGQAAEPSVRKPRTIGSTLLADRCDEVLVSHHMPVVTKLPNGTWRITFADPDQELLDAARAVREFLPQPAGDTMVLYTPLHESVAERKLRQEQVVKRFFAAVDDAAELHAK